MKKAWIENDAVREVCSGDPAQCYHPSVAVLFTTDVPDDVMNGAVWNGSTWVNIAPSIVPPLVDIPSLKREKNEEINAARLSANFSTFTHAGHTFACDELSRSDIDGINGYVAIYDALPVWWPGQWKTTQNTFYPIIDVAGWKAFYTSMVTAGSLNFAHSQALKVELADAITAEEIAAINW